jgi:hypothetical protein
MQLERLVINTSGFEYGRWFENNLYCVLVELASHHPCTLDTVCEDYKIPPETVINLIEPMHRWVKVKMGTPRILIPTDYTKHIFDIIGVNQRW